MTISTRFWTTSVNDLPNVSKIIDPIMFADETNLFFSSCDISVLFATVNNELSKINQWLLSLNVTKAKYSFFYKTNKREDIALKLPRLQINNYNVVRIPSIKFLGVLLDENFHGKTTLYIRKTKFLKIYEYYIRQEII